MKKENIENKKAIWQNQEIIIIRELRLNLQKERMVRIQVSPNQQYDVRLKELLKVGVVIKKK